MNKFLTWLKNWFIHNKEEKTPMSKIKLALAGVLADGTTANTLTVQVTNDAGGVLSGQAVTLTGTVALLSRVLR